MYGCPILLVLSLKNQVSLFLDYADLTIFKSGKFLQIINPSKNKHTKKSFWPGFHSIELQMNVFKMSKAI